MNALFRWSVVFIVTLVISIIGSMPVFVTGLIVHEVVSNSLTIAVMGLLAGLSSSWMSNLLKISHTCSRVMHIVATTEIVAIILAVTYFLITISPTAWAFHRLFPRNIFLLGIWGLVFSVSACLAAWHFRSTIRNLRRDIITSLLLLPLAAIAVVATIAVASLFGLTGA